MGYFCMHAMVKKLSGILFILPLFLHAQVKGLPEVALIMKAGAGVNLGMADMGKRFPLFSDLQASLYIKTPKKFTYGFSFGELLGNRVNIDSLYGGIVGSTEIIYDKNGFPGLIRYYLRGFRLEATAGKIFDLGKLWPHSGIEARLGVGMMQHRIHTRFDVGSLPQIEGDYKYGYDRLSNGAYLSQTIGFHYLNTETVSFFAGITFGQGFTRNRRNWDYSSMKKDNTLRTDMMIGLNAGLLIPISLKYSARSEYFD